VEAAVWNYLGPQPEKVRGWDDVILTELIADLLLGKERGGGEGQGEERGERRETKTTERRGEERRGEERRGEERRESRLERGGERRYEPTESSTPLDYLRCTVLYRSPHSHTVNVTITGRGAPVSAGCDCTVKRISNHPESHFALLSSPPAIGLVQPWGRLFSDKNRCDSSMFDIRTMTMAMAMAMAVAL
jgi:hypothetical protein